MVEVGMSGGDGTKHEKLALPESKVEHSPSKIGVTIGEPGGQVG